MGKSLFLTSETQRSIIITLDNLYIAKLLHDEGYQINPDLHFYSAGYASGENTIFFRALTVLFDDNIQRTVKGEIYDDEGLTFFIHMDDIIHWHHLKPFVSPNEQKELETYFMTPILEVECSYYELVMNSTLEREGVSVKIEGFDGLFSYFFKRFLFFKKQVREVIDELQEREECWTWRADKPKSS